MILYLPGQQNSKLVGLHQVLLRLPSQLDADPVIRELFALARRIGLRSLDMRVQLAFRDPSSITSPGSLGWTPVRPGSWVGVRATFVHAMTSCWLTLGHVRRPLAESG